MGSTISGSGGGGGSIPIDNPDDDKSAKALRDGGGVQDTGDSKDVDDKKAAEDAAAAAAAQQAAATQAAQNARNSDGVDKKGGTDNSNVDGVGAPGDNKQPVKNDSNSDLSTEDASHMGSAILGEIENMYQNAEANLDMQAQAAINDCKGKIEDLERKVKDMTEQIKQLHRAAEKIVFVAEKMAQIVQQLAPYLNHEPSPFARLFGMEDIEKQEMQAKLDQVLGQILKNAGIELNPVFLHGLTSGMMEPGMAGPMMAFYIASKVADMMFEKDHPDTTKSRPPATSDVSTTPDSKPDANPQTGPPAETSGAKGATDSPDAKDANDPTAEQPKEALDAKDRERQNVDATTPDWVGANSTESFTAELEN
jgi:hypothetical protein